MRSLLLFLAATALAHAAESESFIGRLTLLDGRVLKNVVIRTYDTPSSKVLLLSEGKALLIPITIMPPPYAERIKARSARPSADLVQTTPLPPPASEPDATPAPAGPVVVVPTPAPSVPSAPPAPATDPVDPVEAHLAVATAHVRRYYKFEYRTGSNAIAVTDSDIDIEETEPVTGWTNRYRTKGKVFLEIYDSVGGGSFRRGSSRFEVLTEQKPGERIKVVDFTRK